MQPSLRRHLPGLWHPVLPWLLAAITLAAAPHATRTPFWIPLLFVLLAGWRLRRPGSADGTRGGGTLFKLLIGALIVAGVFASYGTLTGRDAGVALLILLAAMKLVEMQGTRDSYIALFIGLFLLLTNFFYAQSLLMAVYTAIAVIVFIAALVSINDARGALGPAARLRLAGLLLLQSLPLMLVLFLLFPRVPGPLWGLPRDARGAQSGLDDQMTPGAISELSLSDEVAFRVEFAGAPPEPAQLYWRGPVLWFTDGVKWVQDRRRAPQPEVTRRGTPVRYIVTMEPTEKNWMYGLELPHIPPQSAYFSHDMQIRTRTPVTARQRYNLVSYPDYTLGTAGYEELIQGLQLPPGRHRRAVALGNEWRESGLAPGALVQRALAMFSEQQFFYTLRPPLLLEDAIDQFLFETRQGFCEHYAAAFVVLMRAAGIPARVVTGYQGGTLNPVGNYLVVRQRDAHAWAEVWLGEDSGWVRVDPTAAVAPSRIMQGIDTALPGALIDIPGVLQNSAMARDLWQRFGFTWDALNNRWNQWVLGYDRNRQSIVLRRLGLGWLDDEGLLIGLSVAAAGVLLLVAWALFRGGPRGSDAARRAWDRFCRRLARRGLERRPQEGPADYSTRAARRFPAQAASIREIGDLYIAVRYAGQPERLGQLQRAVRRL